MTTIVPLKAGAFEAIYTQRIKAGINKALPVLLAELKRLTPEDTKEMLGAYDIEKAQLEGGNVVGKITNDKDYAIIVEYGVNGLTYNYHKPKGRVFYRGVGNRTFARAVDNKRQEVIQIIFNEINK